MDIATHSLLGRGCVIPAHPLVLTATRILDERRQRALTRYYMDAGAGGVAVGVHTTQFAIRDRGLYEPVLALAAETVRTGLAGSPRPFLKVAGVIGLTSQAVREAEIAAALGYDCALLSLGALPRATDQELIAHCRSVAAVLPLFGFYLQTAVGGRALSYDFWQAFSEIENVCAIKIAPFNRYQTLDVVRAVAESGRRDIALYTGNDDSIVSDLIASFPFGDGTTRIVGGLLGQWAVWTRRAVELLAAVHAARANGAVPSQLMAGGATLTAANAAIFDAQHGFAGCIPGIHEVLRRQGLLEGTWCLDPAEQLSPGQSEEIARVCAAHPELSDDEFVAERRDRWLR
ncbi:MAG: dihydrodipicolinate synthase family protein [Gemmatimonadetes bacterium]|nr:dihydrodipicolinate synthase family protein [Gemmatimonadota bacterium]